MIFLLALKLAFGYLEDIDLAWDLNSLTFDDALVYQPKILVYFFTPDCDSCNPIKEEIHQASYKLKEDLIRIGRVNCHEEKAICAKYNISEFPNFLYFVNGKSFKYTGSSTASGITKWLLSKEKSSFEQLKKADSLREKISEKRVSFIHFGELTEDQRKILQHNSLYFDSIPFFHTENQQDFAEFNVDSPASYLYIAGSLKKFLGNLDTVSLKSFLDEINLAKVHDFGDEAIKLVFEQKNPGFFYLRSESSKKKYQLTLEKLADKYSSKLVFVVADLGTKGKSQKLSQALGINSSSQPLAVIVDYGERLNKYRSPESSFSGLSVFIESYFNSSALPFFMSEKIPLAEYKNDVRIIVGANHEEIVMDTDKHVLVLYCTENYDECSEFMPVYEKIGLNYKNADDIVIGKMDIVYNEARNLIISKIPMIKFYPKHNKAGIIYQSSFNMFALQGFLSQHIRLTNQDL